MTRPHSRRRNRELEAHAWKVLSENPNAYFSIPEFDANPSGPLAKDFWQPVSSALDWEPWSDDLVSMIATARTLAKRRFPAIKDLLSSISTALELISEEPEKELSAEHKDALSYFLIMESLRQACGHRVFVTPSPERRLQELASAASMLGQWSLGTFNPQLYSRTHMREIASGPRGSGRNVTPDQVAAFLVERRGTKQLVAIKEAAEFFDTSVSTINRRLKEARERKLIS